MHKLSLTALFFGLFLGATAQNYVALRTEEASNAMAELNKSFVLPPVEEAVPDTLDPWLKWRTVNNYDFGKNRGEMTMIADLSALHPYFRDKIVELITICRSKGIELAVVETYRTVAKQNEYKQLGKIYTRSSGGRSRHQYGLAVDVVPIVDSIASWHNEALWKKVGVVGEKLGLRWGGRWRHPYDPGHFEWSGGVSSTSMAAGYLPRVPNLQLYPCLNEEIKQLQAYWDKWEEEQRGRLSAMAPSKKPGK
jgi:peptidoglycan L-alanyl-D-glutamate endopeptidase CwlK